ncbi:hypothetical protein [Butyrivibrio sp. FCS014]|uniref:hypothetical protein n=1 Tax=Butyrivibrio sp. FCS014 TaxID=1408304 RepID=UPI00046347B8|nr:hypothetical protein [Butyrivibrio sp. FCS014]
MITKDNPSMSSAAESIYLSNADISILEQCRAREDAIAHEAYQKKLIAELRQDLSEANERIEETKQEAALENIRFDRENDIPIEVTRKRLRKSFGYNDATIDELLSKVDAEAACVKS